ncbi:MAG: restriction endonuclease subunit S [Betaproteobacteria bacterium HGW-Betaproteobacteria-9]|jgi:type I restriction enzyme S subunit|nr:MAG: restriction endonuclease subunit S [Betaproteobacteria bacterium HGW-Betaproteobacteria-9]
MSFPRYPAYKDSGIPWVDVIPGTWDVLPLYATAKECDDSNQGMLETNLLSLSYGRMVQKDINSNDGLLPESFETYQIVQPNDIVLRLTDLQNDQRSQRSALVEQTGIITSAYLAIRPQEVSPRFLAHLLRAYDTTKVFYSMGGGLRQSMKFADLKRLPVVLPPKEEQPLIAAFLDHETAKIDALVAAQERLIELLKEKRQAVISHAVTKGLDPSVPMKDSGVEWLGEVPAHWEVSALKRHWSVTDCKHVTAEFVEEGYPLASIREVQSRWVELEEAKRTTEHFYQLLIEGERNPEPGDLIFSRNATVGEVAQVHADHPPFAMGQDVVLLRRIEQQASPDFLQLVLRSLVVVQQLALCMIGSTFKRINVEEIRSLVMAFPPPGEQKRIATRLLELTENFDELIAEGVLSVELLRERRTALISAAVTGQIDVRGWAPAEAVA